MTKFEIQHFTLCNGWINCWHDAETGEPTIYSNFEQALEELDDFLANEEEAYFNGWIEDKYDRSEYRIVELIKSSV